MSREHVGRSVFAAVDVKVFGESVMENQCLFGVEKVSKKDLDLVLPVSGERVDVTESLMAA